MPPHTLHPLGHVLFSRTLAARLRLSSLLLFHVARLQTTLLLCRNAVQDILERGLVTVTLECSTLPWPTGHQVLYDSTKGKKKEDAANKQYRYLEDVSDCLAPAIET